MSTDLKRLEDGSDESLMMLAVEEATAAQEGLNQVIAVANMAVKRGRMAGKCLNIVKARTPHGRWLPLLEKHWPFDRSWATQLMRIANDERAHHFENATSIRECLRIADQLDVAEGIKRGRKRVADPAPEVEVIDNRPTPSRAHTATNATDETDDDEEKHTVQPVASRAHDATEPPPLPKTNTLHTPATQQRIDRGPEPAPSQPVEDAYGMPLLEVVIGNHTTQEVVDALIVGLQGSQAKRVAAILREAAEKLDPQPVIHDATEKPAAKAKKHPTADQLMEVAGAYAGKWSGQLMTQVCKWAEYKQSLAGNAKVRSLASWDAMLTRIDNVHKMRGPGTVCEMINKAIANGWQGWEHDSSSNGKPTVASTRIDHGEDYSDLEYRTA
jgi:hypothetical protein